MPRHKSAFRSTSSMVTMSVFGDTGLRTTTARLTRIHKDRVAAERAIKEAVRQTVTAAQQEAQQEAALEAGDYMNDNAMDLGDELPRQDSSSSSDDDDDDDDDNRNDSAPFRSPEHGLFTAHSRLNFPTHSDRRRNDKRTREIRHASMHAAWTAQLPSLVDEYLRWKHKLAPTQQAPDPVHEFTVTTIDVFDFNLVLPVPQRANEGGNTALVRLGLLGCSPTAPTTAISLRCLELYHQLRRRQSSLSIQAYTKVLCVMHNLTYKQGFRDQFSNAFDVYLSILREVQGRIDHVLGRSQIDWHILHGCPPCTYKQPNERPLYPAQLMAMDGNFSAKRMDGAGHADHRIFVSKFMIRPSDVDVFKHDGQDSDQRADQASGQDANAGCTDGWRAANATEENTVQVFEQTGIFLSACRHGIIQSVTEMRRSGELAKYPLATINRLLDVLGSDLAIGSDIGCSLRKTVASSPLAAKASTHRLLLIVNAFHGHAHNRMCQLQHHPLYIRGVGLEDFETCERVFASSNSTAPLIRHSSHFHYLQYLDLHFNQWNEDKYNELSRFLFNNYKQAIQIIDENAPDLEAFRQSFGEVDFDNWVAEELAYLAAVRRESPYDARVVEYVTTLEKLNKAERAVNSHQGTSFMSYTQDSFTPGSGLNHAASTATRQQQAALRAEKRQVETLLSKVEELEFQLNIDVRWKSNDQSYVSALEYIRKRDFIRVIEDLEHLVVQRLFELSKANLASTGYKLRRKISKAITKRSLAIRSALDRYNKLAPKQSPKRPTLEYSEVLTYASLGEFELLKYSRHEILTKPWSDPTYRQIAVKGFKTARAREEICRLDVEIDRLQAWIDFEDTELQRAIEVARAAESPLRGELLDVYRWRVRVNECHRKHLVSIYMLGGYRGRVYASEPEFVVGEQEGGEEVDLDELLYGEQSARLEQCVQ